MGTHTSGGLYQYGGQPVGGALGASPFGKAFFVDYGSGSDSYDGLTPESAFKTLSAAIAAVVSNRGDVIYIDPYATVVETAMISLTKNRVTIVGGAPPYGHYGQGAKVQIGVTVDTDDIGIIQNTGVRNKFVGIKFDSGNTLTEAKYGFVEGGEYSRFFNCEFYKSTHLGVTDASEFLDNGDSTQFYNCTFGSTANIITDNFIRPAVSLTATISGKKCRDNYFENCLFFSKAGGTEHVAVYGANATDVERLLLMKNCTFVNNVLSVGTPAHAVGFGAAQTQGSVLLQDCASVDFTVMAQASVGIYVAGSVPTFATSGVAVTA